MSSVKMLGMFNFYFQVYFWLSNKGRGEKSTTSPLNCSIVKKNNSGRQWKYASKVQVHRVWYLAELHNFLHVIHMRFCWLSSTEWSETYSGVSPLLLLLLLLLSVGGRHDVTSPRRYTHHYCTVCRLSAGKTAVGTENRVVSPLIHENNSTSFTWWERLPSTVLFDFGAPLWPGGQ